MIVCQICNKEFKSVLTNSHLKTHEVTTVAYAKKFGQLSSAEYRQIIQPMQTPFVDTLSLKW